MLQKCINSLELDTNASQSLFNLLITLLSHPNQLSVLHLKLSEIIYKTINNTILALKAAALAGTAAGTCKSMLQSTINNFFCSWRFYCLNIFFSLKHHLHIVLSGAVQCKSIFNQLPLLFFSQHLKLTF